MEYFMSLPLLKVTITISAGQPELLRLCRRQRPAPKHSIFNSQNTTSITTNQSRNLLAVPSLRESATYRQKLSKEQGMNISTLTASIFPPFPACPRAFCWGPSGESQAASQLAASLGVAPDKDLATPIPTEQQHRQRCPVPAGTADLCNPAPTEEKKKGGVEGATHKVFRYHERTPKQPSSLESASRYISPHLHESIAQDPGGDSPERGVGLRRARINARHYGGAERDPQTRARAAVPPSLSHRRTTRGRSARNGKRGLALKALLPFIN